MQIGKHGLCISHLQFADDSILFCQNDMKSAEQIRSVFAAFQMISGLKINLKKSCVYGVGVPEERMQDVASLLGCANGKLPFNHLGMMFGSNPKRYKSWEPILMKCKQRLNEWKRKNLSLGERIVLIKSVLTGIPLYYMSVFKAPKKWLMSSKKIRRRFLWGANGDGRKLNKIAWRKVCDASINNF